MTVSRTSLPTLVFALLAFHAGAQDGTSGRATAPPRQLNQPHAASQNSPDASTEGLQDDSRSEQTDQDGDEAPEYSTEGLLDDVPEDERSKTERAPAAESGKSAPVVIVPDGPVIPPPQPVQIGTLGRVDGAAVGLLDSSNGGFESNIWNGSPRDQIENLLSTLPLGSTDSAVRALARRLILTKADTPDGVVRRSMATVRIEKLLDAGLVDDAGALAALAQVRDDPDFARVQANALLFAARTKDVCGDLTLTRLSADDTFWLQLRTYCAAASGDTATADLTRSVIDARGESDASFNTLLNDVLSGARNPPGKIAKPTAIHVFLIRKAGVPLNADVAARLGTPGDVLAMRDRQNPPAVRLAAAERALKSGAATFADIKDVAEAQKSPPANASSPLDTAPKLSFLNGQLLLRRAAQLETQPAVKAAFLHEALILGDKAGFFDLASRLQADGVLALDPNTVPPDQRPLLGWALLLAGKNEAASRWIGDAHAPHAVLALVTGRPDSAQADLSELARDVSVEPKAPNPNRPFEALILGLYDALGYTLPADAKSTAQTASAKHWPGRRPDSDAMQKMVQAAAMPSRKGEAVLRVLGVVGAKGPGDLAPDVTVECVRALEEMGIKEAAHALAAHALLLYRPSAS